MELVSRMASGFSLPSSWPESLPSTLYSASPTLGGYVGVRCVAVDTSPAIFPTCLAFLPLFFFYRRPFNLPGARFTSPPATSYEFLRGFLQLQILQATAPTHTSARKPPPPLAVGLPGAA